jgi:hypothetical protein
VTPRRLVAIVAVTLVIAAAAITWIGWQGFREWQDAHRACDLPASLPAQATAAATRAPDGGGIQIMEQGFTDNVDGGASLGALLRNTSASVALGTTVSYRVYDPQGRPDPILAQSQQIPILLPGQRIGVGQFIGRHGRVASFEVEVGTSRWLPRSALGGHFTSVTAAVQQTERDPNYGWVARSITYTETSGNCRDLESGPVATVFRDHAGAIVGGSNDPSFGGTVDCRRGHSTLSLEGLTAPVGADDTRTEVYPYCGLTAAP